ncbi:MAG: hypothetical protein Ta2B_12890 [Termitinemataceae bacterium]|nr:MAG: hypothetical protein Ta2B_12890 [Termitinemataceae bacterium]
MTNKKMERTEELIVEIKLAFMGTTCNFYLLEEMLVKKENISIPQYVNYLSQIAMCIELGLKSIIINTDGFDRTHELECLFSLIPDVVKNELWGASHGDKSFESYMSNTKKMFSDFRYMKTESTLKKYFCESMVNGNRTINIKEAINTPPIEFLQNLLEGILAYEKYIRDEAIKNMKNIDCSNPDSAIKQYAEIVKQIQSTLVSKHKA